jgi:preprotein translocase subunit SecD
MKKISAYVLLALVTIISCNTNNGGKEKSGQSGQFGQFGIYETVMGQDLLSQGTGELATTKVIPNTDPLSPVVAYSHVDSATSVLNKGTDSIGFLLTAQPVDPEKNYYAVVAVKKQPAVTGSDIKKTKAVNNAVEIYFTQKGAVKWAEFTRNNTGKMIAFVINDRIYTLTTVMAEIRNGMALMNGLENEETAAKISETLNAAR